MAITSWLIEKAERSNQGTSSVIVNMLKSKSKKLVKRPPAARRQVMVLAGPGVTGAVAGRCSTWIPGVHRGPGAKYVNRGASRQHVRHIDPASSRILTRGRTATRKCDCQLTVAPVASAWMACRCPVDVR